MAALAQTRHDLLERFKALRPVRVGPRCVPVVQAHDAASADTAQNTALCVNLKKFNSLSADLQKALIDAAAETEKGLVSLKKKEFDDAWQVAKKNGMVRIDWPKDVNDSFFNDVMKKSWARVEKSVGKELVDKMRPMMSR